MNINRDKKNLSLTIAYVSVFALSLILRIWFNFFDTHANAAFAFDAAEYLRHAQNINLTFSQLREQPGALLSCFKILFGGANFSEINQIKEVFAPLQSMSIAGPVFPVFLLACFKLFGKAPSFEDWMLPIAMQCLFTSLIPVLIMAIGNKCWDKRTGIIAGLLAAIYPGFIVGSGRLYSESFACFFICLILWLITSYFTKGRIDFTSGFLLGLSLFALQMTRSIMILVSLGVILFLVISSFIVIDRRRQILRYLLAVMSGLTLCLLPWLAIQKLTTGKASIIIDRVSNYNLLVGNDIDGLGWLSIPYQDCSKTNQENYGHIMKIAISRSPSRWFKLMLDKPVRLLKLPWNDFKTAIGVFSPFSQTAFHQFILALAAVGLILSSTILSKQNDRQKIIGRSIILLVFLLHFVYLFFITLPRYALTAMPEVLLFAAAGLAIISKGLSSRKSIPITIKLIAAVILLILLSKLNILEYMDSLNNTDYKFTQLSLFISVLFKLTIFLAFLNSCWQMFVQMQPRCEFKRQVSYVAAFLIIVLFTIFTLPAYCLPLRAHGRWYEWTLPFNNPGQEVRRLIALDKNLTENLSKNGGYLAINLEGGNTLTTSTNIFINGIRIDSPIIPAMAICQNMNLVNSNSNNQLTLEQEFIFQCLCKVSSKNPLDLRQWYFIPIQSAQWRSIIDAARAKQNYFNDFNNDQGTKKQLSDDLVLHVTLHKNDNTQTTIYGAYPTDPHFSFIPSFSRFSWEKAFYSSESETGLNDPSYDEKIEQNNLHQGAIAPDDQLTPDLYIKLLVPLANKAAVLKTSGFSTKHNQIETNGLKITDEQYKETASSSEHLLFFQSLVKTAAVKTTILKDQGKLWLIRLKGEIRQDGIQTFLPEVNIHFSRIIKNNNKQTDLSYKPVWLPTNSSFNLQESSHAKNKQTSALTSSPLKFDYCIPILLSAFPGQLTSIDLNNSNDQNDNINFTKRNKNTHVKCSLQIYEMPNLLFDKNFEIF